MSVAHFGPSAALLERLAGGLLLTTVLYLALFWLLGEGGVAALARSLIFWLPAVFILLPGGWGLGVLPLLVYGLSPHGALVLWWLRGGGVAQPPLSALLHDLLPAQCHRPDRAPIHSTVKRSQDQGLSLKPRDDVRSEQRCKVSFRGPHCSTRLIPVDCSAACAVQVGPSR